MTAEGHLLFSIACAVFAKNAELTPVLAQGASKLVNTLYRP